MFSYKN
jgi:hypothetical protein